MDYNNIVTWTHVMVMDMVMDVMVMPYAISKIIMLLAILTSVKGIT